MGNLAAVLWTLLWGLCSVNQVHAYSFLLVPLPLGSSPCREVMGIGQALQQRGHTVNLLLPQFVQQERCVPKHLLGKVNVLSFPVDEASAKVITGGLQASAFGMGSNEGGRLHTLGLLKGLIPKVCGVYAQARPLLDQFLTGDSTSSLDMILLDGVPFTRCLRIISEYLHTPASLVGSFIDVYDTNMPWPVLSYPNLMSNLPGQMSFGQRVLNTLAYCTAELFWRVLSSGYEYGDDYGEQLAGFDLMANTRKAVLFLENSDYIVDYPKATYPNFVQVGGLSTAPARPMPIELQGYFDSCPQGVVVVSLGSIIYNISQDMTDKLLSAMAKVKVNVVMRLSVEKASVPVAKHVKIVNWFPQNDALGHRNTKLFVSHCGKNGFFEGLYHGIPILCTPLNGDGVGTGQRVSDFGVGGSVNLRTVTADELADTINNILSDSKIWENMKFYSRLFHDRPETPQNRSVTALEHVIKYGGNHLRPTTTDLSYIQYTGLDIFFTLFAGVVTVSGLVLFICGSICCRLMRKLGILRAKDNRSKTQKQD